MEQLCTINNNIVKCDENGNPYLSAYRNEMPVDQKTAEIILETFFATFGIKKDAEIAYVSTVIEEKMSRERLVNSVKNLFKTFSTKDYKPMPCDLISYDKKDETVVLYNTEQMYHMCKGMVRKYYDMEKSENIYNETANYNRCRDKFFRRISEKAYAMTEEGIKRENELLNILNTDLNKIRYIKA